VRFFVHLVRRSLPKKVTDAMTCSECCKDRVLLTQETIDGMEKYMTKAVNTPWVVGEQHLKMNEFLTSMDQVSNFPTACCAWVRAARFLIHLLYDFATSWFGRQSAPLSLFRH
jgi:hypothetical protein